MLLLVVSGVLTALAKGHRAIHKHNCFSFVVLVQCILQICLSSLASATCLKPKHSFPATHLLQSFPLLPALHQRGWS